jgi:hypothetical protein
MYLLKFVTEYSNGLRLKGVNMSNKTTYLIFMIFLSICNYSFAQNFPKGCETSGYSFKENHLVINDTGKQTLFLIKNDSRSLIELMRHETRDVFMSPKLQIKLFPNRWSAFASDEKQLHFKCYRIFRTNTEAVNCSEVLKICQYPRVKFATSNMGNYWVSFNKSLRNTMRDAIKKGILLRW